MATAPIGGQPGSAGASTTYPQWGYNQAGSIVRASSSSQKLSYEQAGYLDWFTSKAAAQAAYAGSTGVLGTGNLPVPSGLAAVGDFFNKLGQAGTWIRVAEVFLGLALIIAGVAKLASGTPIGAAAQSIGTKAALL